MPENQTISSRPKILVVDDQEVNLELMEAHLVPEGYDVCLAEDGPMALQKLEEDKPDLILLDVMMPGMDGHEVCRRLRNIPGNEATPVVMITALEDEVENRVQSIEAGADDFIEKPVVKRELLARVQSLLQKHRLYQSLNKQNERLQEASQMSHQLRHLILHDMSTPISELDMAVHLALRREKDRQQAQLLKWMSLSTDRLNRLTGDLLDIDRLEDGCLPLQKTAVDLNALIRIEISHLRKNPQNAQRHILCSLEPSLPLVTADPSMIHRVLVNLLSNVLKYTPPDSDIRISTQDHSEYAQVNVVDNGPGIPPEERELVFDRYYRAKTQCKEHRGGQGLGLTFCKMVVETHGGRIWVDGDEGAHFHFTLPTADTCEPIHLAGATDA